MSNGTAIVTCLALLHYGLLAVQVARARVKYSIEAPATAGHPLFERTLRIQANTGEQLLLFLPSLWLFSYYVSPLWASLLGLVWLIGRMAYVRGYTADPRKRRTGFGISFTATLVLFFGAFIAAILTFFSSGI